MERKKELDYLRGLCALGILFYHYLKWLYLYEGANTLIGKIGVYGVAAFYIISGCTMYLVYNAILPLKRAAILNFYKKRALRILPLLYLSIFLTVLIRRVLPEPLNLVLNVSGLFSVFAFDKYIAVGSWSIGNEIVFYAFFPFLIYLSNSKIRAFWLFGFLFGCIYFYFAFFLVNPDDTLHNQWSLYIHPANQLLLFFLGVVIAKYFNRVNNKGALICLVISVSIFAFYPSTHDGISLIYGTARWVFTLATSLLCVAFFMMNIPLRGLLNIVFSKLGEISYGVYLLHPIVYQVVCNTIRKLQFLGVNIPHSNLLLISICTLATLMVSYLSYTYFELPIIRKQVKKITL